MYLCVFMYVQVRQYWGGKTLCPIFNSDEFGKIIDGTALRIAIV